MSSIKLKHSGGNAVSLHAPTSAPTATDVQFKLPTADGSSGQVLQTDGSGNLSWVTLPSSPINQISTYRLNASEYLEGSDSVISANWEESDEAGHDRTGTALTHSSGVWTFPTTGKYLIIFSFCIFFGTADDYDAIIHLETTTDGSNFNINAVARTSGDMNGSFTTVSGHAFLDIANVSTHKMRFHTSSFAGNTRLRGHSDENMSYFTAIRIGDT
jgi:hypothetical protein|tara:strand:- start:884 stop:1528 length:645 start_codon:yes stop_codon:yes gene_type:complete